MRSSQSSPVLLLTATIDPGGTPFVARSDPRVRLRDYEQSLTAWLSSGAFQKIALYENSGYDISSLQDIAQRFPKYEVEFHSFRGNEAGVERGKGYPELMGIERMIAQSTLVRNCRYIAKCTGRLTVGNALELMRRIEGMDADRFDIMCLMAKNFTFADSRFFLGTPEFFLEYLIPLKTVIDDKEGVYFEHALAYATTRALSERKQWRPFPILPQIRGVSGTFDVSHTLKLRKRIQESIFHKVRNYLNER